MPGRRHEYAYDSIGNRQWSNSTGVSGLRDDYTANALNQYVARENNTLSLSGTATSDAVVAVKGRTVTAGRQGRFWSDEVTVSNVLGPWAGPLSVYATKSAAGSNVMRIDSRAAQLPAVSQSFSYDLDGNTLSDGIWDYQWDAENRLVRLETTVAARSAGFAHRILNFTYDYLGRRVQKQVIDGVTSTELSSQRFIYNGWDVIAEYSVTAGTTLDKLQRTYAWGIDLASSLTKAGGVGALLQFANTPTGQTYLPTHDGNGNVASLVSLGTGALAAAYEYTPFGEMLRDEVLDNAVSTYAFKFSTKWRDAETGWSYYGRRYYFARMGRFVGRDPIGEEGGINLYGFCGNNSGNRWDRNGENSYYTQIELIIKMYEEGIGLNNLSSQQLEEYSYWCEEKGRIDVFDIAPNLYSFNDWMENHLLEMGLDPESMRPLGESNVDENVDVSNNTAVSTVGSFLGNALRGIPLIGGMLGAAGDIVSGVGNVALGTVTFGSVGSFFAGLSQIGSGIANGVTILGTDVVAAFAGSVGTHGCPVMTS